MTNHLFDLTGKVALVTGCNRGIGQAMALGLAGARIVLMARRLDARIVEQGKGFGGTRQAHGVLLTGFGAHERAMQVAA